MARISIVQAAKAGWASRPTIYRAIKEGRLTAYDEAGRKVVDVADLERLFGSVTRQKTAPAPTPADTEAISTAKLEAELVKKDDEIARLRSDLDAERRRREDERQDRENERKDAAKERDRLLSLAESATKQIEDMREEAKTTRARKGWLSRVFGGGGG